MKADFSGYATKANVLCSDGRTILPDAFKHQDAVRVPLVWQHTHTDPENVLGHAILENRPDGVYAYGFFNDTPKAKHTHALLEHGDINMMSIWANQLVERSKKVLHGAIREVSLVLAGANPGALIESVTLRHSDGETEELIDEAIIYTGELLHVDHEDVEDVEEEKEEITHATDTKDDKMATEDLTIQDVYDSLNDDQKQVVHYMIGQALEAASDNVAQSGINEDEDNTAVHGDNNKEGNNMTHRNVFEKTGEQTESVLSHDDMMAILTAGKKGSLKEAVEEYALAHNITDIDVLFPDAKALDGVPEWNKRRTEWVTELIGATRKSPFSRIKTVSADITEAEARAKGYVTGAFKKEEFFPVVKRVTTPTTIYKKQALDRDDVVDITDFDVVAWLKGEMRIMLDEELARAVLIGDGRDISDEDKINEQCIRPIATDNELYTTTVNVNIDDSNSSMMEVLDAVIDNRYKLKGTGSPNFYTTEYWIARFMKLRDGDGHRMYRSLSELAVELRANTIVPVEALLESPNIVGIFVNPVDYVIGADKGGQVSMFDDFDIDYNKQKYLIETRVSGALTKLKSAMVIMRVAGTDVLVSPNEPTFVEATGVLSIVNQTGVVYKNAAGTVLNAAGSPYAAIPAGTSVDVFATPASGYYFATSDDDTWHFTRDA